MADEVPSQVQPAVDTARKAMWIGVILWAGAVILFVLLTAVDQIDRNLGFVRFIGVGGAVLLLGGALARSYLIGRYGEDD